MTHPRRHFDFDKFDKLCAEALDEDHLMAEESRQLEEEQAWEEHDRVFLGKRPGEIGAVVTRLSFRPDFDSLPEPPEAA